MRALLLLCLAGALAGCQTARIVEIRTIEPGADWASEGWQLHRAPLLRAAPADLRERTAPAPVPHLVPAATGGNAKLSRERSESGPASCSASL